MSNYYPNFYSNFDNSFTGYYVNDYSEVLNMVAPVNGSAVLFANLDKGKLWSKKIIQGQAFIQEYEIRPVNNSGGDLMKRLEEMELEIKRLKGVSNEPSGTNVNDKVEAK